MKAKTLMADPPWPYKTPGKGPLQSSPKHRPNSWDNPLAGSGLANRYGTMTLKDIEALPVQDLCADDCHLYLWTTNGFIEQAHAVARAWGFRPITVITWGKVKGDGETPSMKTGYYFRGATEHVVFGVRGSLDLISERGVSTLFLHPRTAHSVKPEAFYKLVEECSPEPRVSLFERQLRPGWAVWGNEVGSDAKVAAVLDRRSR